METLSEIDFLAWAEARGLALDSRYPESSLLTFVSDGAESRRWSYPPEFYRSPYFLGVLLDLLGDWESCYVWRHMGSWPANDEIDQLDASEVVERSIYSGLGVPSGSANILQLARDDRAGLLTLMFCARQFGWSVGEDIHIVPDHARQFLMLSHHDVVHVHFRQSEDIAAWADHMVGRSLSQPLSD